MLMQKRDLADMTVAAGENWIGDLSASELAAVLSLANPELKSSFRCTHGNGG